MRIHLPLFSATPQEAYWIEGCSREHLRGEAFLFVSSETGGGGMTVSKVQNRLRGPPVTSIQSPTANASPAGSSGMTNVQSAIR